MEADAAALWNVLHDRQWAFETRRLGNAYRVTNGGDLVADTLKGVAEESTVDNKATSDGIALRLISNQSYIHNFLGFIFKTIIVNLIVNYSQFKESILFCSNEMQLRRI